MNRYTSHENQWTEFQWVADQLDLNTGCSNNHINIGYVNKDSAILHEEEISLSIAAEQDLPGPAVLFFVELCLRTWNKQLYSPQGLVTARQILLPKISDSTITATSVLGNKASFSPGTTAELLWNLDPPEERGRSQSFPKQASSTSLLRLKKTPTKQTLSCKLRGWKLILEEFTGFETVTAICILG